MKDFTNKIAVITGGGSGIGRELALQLVSEGCSVGLCDLFPEGLEESARLCRLRAAAGASVVTHVADVSDERQLQAFREVVAAAFDTEHIDLLINNAGIGGNASMLDFSEENRKHWERTFNICWGGVYFGTRTFLPMLVRSREGHIANMSSINGFWAMINPNEPRSSYSAAKFAVKGFTEALIGDLRLNAPHVHCSVIMPGHIGTPVALNQRRVQSGETSGKLSTAEIANIRQRLRSTGVDEATLSDEEIRLVALGRARRYMDEAPTSAAEAAQIILKGIREKKWRILVGHDAEVLDHRVRAEPDQAYDLDFFKSFSSDVGWRLGG